MESSMRHCDIWIVNGTSATGGHPPGYARDATEVEKGVQ